ncbi:MAG: hypothetical protein IT376_08320 [Polyangiaceae bacterium]|nr:hypothetical protein [Polyangiaceae bacterium]
MTRRPAPAALRRRILGVFPAAHYALDGLLRLLDIALDDSVDSAAVECRAAPLLLLNPAFLERYCRTDEHLAMLVLHEVHHVLLGHTRLFPRMTEAQNLAFDAVINAVLCHMFPAEAYRGFFEALNAADAEPACFLRPPPGWPSTPEPPAALAHPVRELVLALYGESGVGYAELFRAVERAIGGGACPGQPGGYTLVGDHGPEAGLECRAAEAARAPALLDALRSVVERWPTPADPSRGRGVGSELRDALVGERVRVPAAVVLLRRMFRTLALGGAGAALRTRLGLADRIAETSAPQLRDRRALVRGLLGETPLSFRVELPQRAPLPEPAVVHVYLDVSGSTDPYRADLLAAVRPHVARGRCAVHAFSERVVDLDASSVRRGRVRTTGGTDIACVTEHMVRNRVGRALWLTDGWVGHVPPAHHAWLWKRRAVIDVALTPGGSSEVLRGVARTIVPLPPRGVAHDR